MQIRKKIFETNSSSTHSVVIEQGTDFVIPEIKGDTIEISGGEFGWEQETYTDWLSKASYAYTYAKNSGRKEDLELLKKVIEDYTKKEVIFVTLDSEYDPDGYIDHQSIGEAKTIFADYETVKKVIFGKDSEIITNNDNN